ncbi:MAG: VOC family protein [Acidimicrobiia bacterium]|nr:VOC family protein [Acidimicrobiia bacterium]
MTLPARVNLVTLGVADVARATAFYEALGWRRSRASEPAVTFFHTGGPVVALFGDADLAADAGMPATPLPAFRGVALAVNVADPAAVDRALDDAVAAGATLVKAATRADWGGYSGYFADPDGHLWEVAHNPGFPLDDDGAIVLP